MPTGSMTTITAGPTPATAAKPPQTAFTTSRGLQLVRVENLAPRHVGSCDAFAITSIACVSRVLRLGVAECPVEETGASIGGTYSNPPVNRPRIRELLSFIPTISTVFPNASYFVSIASNAATVDASHTCDPDRSMTTRDGSEE